MDCEADAVFLRGDGVKVVVGQVEVLDTQRQVVEADNIYITDLFPHSVRLLILPSISFTV